MHREMDFVDKAIIIFFHRSIHQSIESWLPSNDLSTDSIIHAYIDWFVYNYSSSDQSTPSPFFKFSNLLIIYLSIDRSTIRLMDYCFYRFNNPSQVWQSKKMHDIQRSPKSLNILKYTGCQLHVFIILWPHRAPAKINGKRLVLFWSLNGKV